MKFTNNNLISKTNLLVVLIFSSLVIYGQKGEIGLRYMPTYSSLDFQTSSGGKISGEGTFGYGIGAILGFNFSEHVGIQGELIYSSYNQRYKEVDNERRINLKYINIPMLISLNTGKTKPINISVVAGPQIGVSVGSSVFSSSPSGTSKPVLALKRGDLGFAYGVGIDFAMTASGKSRFQFGYRGVSGLLDISDNSKTLNNDSFYVLDKSHIRTNALYVGLSLLF